MITACRGNCFNTDFHKAEGTLNEQRLEEIETKLAFQERTIKELNDVVCEQQKQIDQLSATCKLLVKRSRDSSEEALRELIDEKPPHY